MSTTPVGVAELERDLRSRVRGDVFVDDVRLGIYATDASNYQIRPVAVVVPRDVEDVRAAALAARDHGVPLLPRGGGTALAGQTVGAALVLDFSKWMNRIVSVHPGERRVRVQPGIVRDELNAALAPHGLHFAPDPATGNRATIGGMIASNSSGTKSLRYGKTVDHVIEARVMLPDGEVVDLLELSPDEYDERSRGDGREAGILRGVREIVGRHRDEIERRYPKIMRRVMGYNLDELANAERWNLAKLFAGSEGTLGILLEATLRLEPLPACKGLCIVHFDDLLEALRGVAPILGHGPAAVEILDGTVLELALGNRTTAHLCGFLEGRPRAILVVEFFGEDESDVRRQADGMVDDLRSRGVGRAWPILLDPARQADVWTVRKNGLGLLNNIPGDRKPIPFVEDASVPIEHLPEYVEKVLAICRDRGVDVTLYAHASVGVLHIRPILDLRRREDIVLMKHIAASAHELVKGYGGCVSGEHGDGLVRSPFIEWFYGPEITGAFREVKRLFDPEGRMNPGKIVDPSPMDANLRYGESYRAAPFETVYRYRDEGSFAAAVERCIGVGACRKTADGTMCPSYMATRDEEHSTRGRANALRLAMTGQLGADGMTSRGLFEALDLCLSCKACKSECPSEVDVAKLKSEFLQSWRDRHGTTLRDRLIGASPRIAARLSGPLAPLVNAVQRTAAFRWLLEKTAGFDRRRTLPPYAREPFSRWFEKRRRKAPLRPATGAPARPRVVLFDDTYLSYHEPSVGRAAVELLEGCGYEVIPARAGCCQRPRISHGLLREARRDGERTLRNLDRFAREGLPILCCEPSCASALVDDLPDLVEDAELGRRVARHVRMIDVFLDEEIRAGHLDASFEAVSPEILLHGHCHQKALFGTDAIRSFLSRVENLEVREIPSGCCGMAGSFGYEREHHDLSMRVGEDRLFPALREAPPDATVLACGFSCRHQIAAATGRHAVHFVEAIGRKS
jgi:FAD/FMN-containing dehydrogenase/Fe-S oxidoreductase